MRLNIQEPSYFLSRSSWTQQGLRLLVGRPAVTWDGDYARYLNTPSLKCPEVQGPNSNRL